MSKVFLRKQFSNYLGENRALDDIIVRFIPDGGITPTPTPVPPTPTPTPSITPSITPSVTPTRTLTPTPTITSTPTNTPSITPTRTPAPACDITYTELPSPTPSPTPTITPTASPGPSFDPDAAAYLSAVVAAGGSVTSPMSAATNNMFLALKSNGLYNKLDVFYPMMGATAASTALNAIRTNSAFDITWNNVGDLSFTISGVTNNGTGYGNTNYNPNTQSSPTNTSFGYYIVGGNIGGGNGEVFPFGSYDGNLNMLYQNSGTIEIGIYGWSVANDTRALFTADTGSNFFKGSWIGTFNSTPLKSIYYNYSDLTDRQTLSGTPIGSPALPNQPYYMFVLNLNGSPYTGQYYTGRNQFAFMGDYLTPAEVTTIDSIINAFQTSLGRNTY
jgi:hypothetical protein